ncbi:MAG: FAD-binding protein, partial [Thermomicrobiales bacterium]|nr:FAD-binding protein [Thermomicrobiales bacterium]
MARTSRLPGRKPDRADVVIVGAGVGGALTALTLAQAGLKVVCLEQGTWVDSSEFWGDKPEWELMAQKRW